MQEFNERKNMQRKVTLSIGHNVGNEVEAVSTEMIEYAITDVLEVDGATFYNVDGVWQGQTETSTRVEIYCTWFKARKIKREIPRLASLLEQHSIYYECELSNSIEIEAPRKLAINR